MITISVKISAINKGNYCVPATAFVMICNCIYVKKIKQESEKILEIELWDAFEKWAFIQLENKISLLIATIK